MRGNKPYGGPEAARYPDQDMGMHEENGMGRIPIRDLPYLGDNTQVFIGLMIGWVSAPLINQLWKSITRTIGIRRR